MTTKKKKKRRRVVAAGARPKGGGRAQTTTVNRPKRLATEPYEIGDGVTQSVLGNWTNCRRAQRWSLDGWRRRETKEALVFGSLFHKLLEEIYRGAMRGEVTPDDAPRIFDEVVAARTTALRAQGASPSEVALSELCVARAKPVFDAYCLRYAGDDFAPDLWVELEGTFDTVWKQWRLRGMRDGLQQVGRRQMLRMLETKTKGQIGKELDRALGFNFQNLFYLTSLNASLAERGERRRCTKVLYNIIRRPGLKLGKDESLPEHSARIAEHIVKSEKDPKKGLNYYFVRFEITYSLEDQKMFAVELEQKLRDFEAWTRGELPTYRNESACCGRWNCGYIPLCGGEDPDVEFEQNGVLFEELFE